MSQIMYNYPAMLGHAGIWLTCRHASLGAEIAVSRPRCRASGRRYWITYQAWQAQWNQAMEDLVCGPIMRRPYP